MTRPMPEMKFGDPEWTVDRLRRLAELPPVAAVTSCLKQRELREKVARDELTEYPSEEVEDFGG